MGVLCVFSQKKWLDSITCIKRYAKAFNVWTNILCVYVFPHECNCVKTFPWSSGKTLTLIAELFTLTSSWLSGCSWLVSVLFLFNLSPFTKPPPFQMNTFGIGLLLLMSLTPDAHNAVHGIVLKTEFIRIILFLTSQNLLLVSKKIRRVWQKSFWFNLSANSYQNYC